MKRTIYINEDNGHFYRCHPPEDMTPEGVQRLVDFYVDGTQVAGILFCVNVQRALFNSRVWETFYDDYDPEKGEEQLCRRRGKEIENLWLLNHKGIDYHKIWLERCRHHGVEGWLSMRMNDSHGLKEYQVQQEDPDAEIDHSVEDWPSALWRERPDLRRAPYRWERSWEGSFDYGKKEVREHHLNLIRELFERYDMFGLELDWMRWGMMFAPGHEQAGFEILTDFMREVRRLADENEKRVGHPVQLSVRIPADPQSCLALGYDVISWANEGLIHQVTLSSFLGAADFDYPIQIWRALLGGQIKILALAEPVARPAPNRWGAHGIEFLLGSAASALQHGADGVYLFNECYRESTMPEMLRYIMTHAGQLDTLDRTARRFAVGYPQVHAAGQASKAVLPIPLRQEHDGFGFGRLESNITLRIASGRAGAQAAAFLRLGFSAETPALDASALTVWMNGAALEQIAPDDERLRFQTVAERFGPQDQQNFCAADRCPDNVAQTVCCLIPQAVLQDDINVVEFVPPQVDGELVWAEIIMVPEKMK